MSDKYTYMWNLQPYKKDKGISRIETAPSNARPLTNGNWDAEQFNNNIDGNAFIPRPIKHWRKQLQTDPTRGGSKSKIIIETFQPGGTSYLNANVNEERECCELGQVTTKVVSSIDIEKNNKFCANSNCSYTVTAEDVENGWNGPIGKKICCNPEKNVIKRGTTLLSKKYYTDSKAYLRSRNKLYTQKLTILPYSGVNYYNSRGEWLYPDNILIGPQVFSTGECNQSACRGSQQITIFKPNNRQFKVQGAVSSSTRLNKLKLDTLNKSANSMIDLYGKSAASAARYYLNGNEPYFIKNKIEKCVHHYKYCNNTNNNDTTTDTNNNDTTTDTNNNDTTTDTNNNDTTTDTNNNDTTTDISNNDTTTDISNNDTTTDISNNDTTTDTNNNDTTTDTNNNEEFILYEFTIDENINYETVDLTTLRGEPIIGFNDNYNKTMWRGGVLADNGNIYCIPHNSEYILVIDSINSTIVTTIPVSNVEGSGWEGGVLAPNGKIYCIPHSSDNVLIIDPTTNTVDQNSITGLTNIVHKWGNGVLAPNGKIYCVPRISDNVLIIDPATNTVDQNSISGLSTDIIKWSDGVLAPNGKIYFIPHSSDNVLIIDPATNTVDQNSISGLSLSYPSATVLVNGVWRGCVLAPNGNIYCIPFIGNYLLVINTPTNNTLEIPVESNMKFNIGGVYAPNGKIYCIPFFSSDGSITIIDIVTNEVYRDPNLKHFTSIDRGFSYGVLAENNIIYGITSGYVDGNTPPISSILMLPPTITP